MEHNASLWTATAPPPPATPPLRGAHRCDVAVVGGGYTGLSAALTLARAGAAVTLLEAREIGFGGSGRNSGLVNAGLWLNPDDIRARLGDAAEPLIAALKTAPAHVFDLIARHGIDCEATRNGTLWCARDDAGLRKIETRCAQVNADGAQTLVLDGAEARARLGGEDVIGALFDPAAGTIQPMGYARGLARAALAAGARIHAQSPVGRCVRAGKGWTLSTPQGAVTADRAILGLNAYGEGCWPEIAAAQIPLGIFHMATAPLGEAARGILPGGEGAWSAESILSIWRRDRAGRLILGSIGDAGGATGAIHRAWALRATAAMFPQLGPVSIERAWTGRVAMTGDHLPACHEIAPGIVTFAGFNGRGIGPGTVIGGLLARHALGDGSALPLAASPLAPAPLRRVRELFFSLGAAAAHLVAARG